jgi:hypothetical protein
MQVPPSSASEGELDDEGEMIWKLQWPREIMPDTFASLHQLRPLDLLLPLDEVIDDVAGVSTDGE